MPITVVFPWFALVALGLVLLARLAMLMVALRGTRPRERPAILRALADLTTPRLYRHNRSDPAEDTSEQRPDG